MKAFFSFILVFFIALVSMAQKNVIPATRVAAINLVLPEASIQDKRFLITVAAATLLETEVHDPTIKLTGVEVYFLPSVTKSGFNEDVLLNHLENSGFQILPTEDEKMAWLIKGVTSFLIYFSMDKAETVFYIGKSNTVPKTTQASPAKKAIPNTPQERAPSHIPPLPPARFSNPIRNN